ncbi:MAG TPA: hypothetical protein VMT15_05360 [Bryobacteraceae bacterium]|nr:hypothetical protein [Bryobacteraceae bacterium]
MRRVALFSTVWIFLLSIAAWAGDDKDKDRFAPTAVSSYKGATTIEKIAMVAAPYVSDEQIRSAFGKVNPPKYGVLPVLVVLENQTGKALKLDLQASYIRPDGKHIDATPAPDVTFIGGSGKPPSLPGSSPIPFPRKSNKGPLNTWEIEGRAFSAKIVPVGEKAYGFFYFQTDYLPGARILLTGISDASTGKEFLYFEVPLEKQ